MLNVDLHEQLSELREEISSNFEIQEKAIKQQKEALAIESKKFSNLKPINYRKLGMNWVWQAIVLVLICILFLLYFTPLGELAGLHAGWLEIVEDNVDEDKRQILANRDAVLAATRYMINILGPIFIGLAI